MSYNMLLKQVRIFLLTRFSLHKDKEDESEIVDSIRKGIVFRGINVWILIFAIFLASIGLNVNSTAVIIGAMLISPLIGPIMGIGLGLGIFDFEMVKLAAKNLAIMVIVSLSASTLYFLLSPLNEAQSELLARTTPTIWDVLIALFGGLAGIVAGASKEKGNVIPGVAIATALMPPLCTAGFGIASGDFYFFLGAFYLFCINAVFISVSTFTVVRILKFNQHKFFNHRIERRVKNIITIIVIITIIPSALIAYITVTKEIFNQKALDFVGKEFAFENTLVLSTHPDYENNAIEVVLLGEQIGADTLQLIRERAQAFGLEGTLIDVKQGIAEGRQKDLMALRTGIVQELYSYNQKLLQGKDSTIRQLQGDLAGLQSEYKTKDIATELNVFYPGVISMSLTRSVWYNVDGKSSDTITTAIASFKRKPGFSAARNIENWLKVRTKSDSLALIIR